MRNADDTRNFWLLVALGGLVTAVGLGAAHYMEVHGHIVTGMTNQVVWGLPHVFAIFMVVAASGVLNVASIGSVFGQPAYKRRAPLSGLLCLALLVLYLIVLSLPGWRDFFDVAAPDPAIVLCSLIGTAVAAGGPAPTDERFLPVCPRGDPGPPGGPGGPG